ncbi:MAG: DUF4294 domain-containing protein [Bacteroidia bacterium]|nr:DUF4294 domain-containing protein [Bacteroidia bacterium]
MTVRICAVIFLMLSIPVISSGQTDSVRQMPDTSRNRVFVLQEVERGGEVLPEVAIKEVTIVGQKSASRKVMARRYDRMVYNLKKVYPYAVIVREKLYQVNQELAAITDEKERKKYLKGVEEFVLGEYEDDMRDMTITQGRLLIKMVDRETRNTSFNLIKEYRGGLSASFWQGIARIFGTNLKAEYDPFGDDAMMEILLLQIEAGTL